MSYQKFALRLAFLVTLILSASVWVFAQDQQDPSTKPRNVKPELKKAYKDWLDKDVTYIITDEERKAFKKLRCCGRRVLELVPDGIGTGQEQF